MDTHIEQTARRLNLYCEAYARGEPLIPDDHYDALEQYFKSIAPTDHPFFKQVAGDFSSTFEQATTGIPMKSLNKTRLAPELVKFIHNRAIIVNLKLDGCSNELRYKDGYLVESVSRGRDGLGFVNTSNAMYLLDVPHVVKGYTGIIRGEAMQLISDFNQFVIDEVAAGRDRPKHPRGVAIGAMKNDDPRVVAQRKIRFRACRILGQVDQFPTEKSVNDFFEANGFIIPKYEYYAQPEVFTHYVEENLARWKNIIDTGDLKCDGLVITYNDRKLQEQLGEHETYPNWAKAFKWENEKVATKTKDIEWNVGKSGKVMPRGVIEAVECSGATLTHCNFYNVGYVREHQITIGSDIIVMRSGEIIPVHVETIQSTGIFNIPTNCPSCNSILEEVINAKDPEKGTLFCRNPLCPAQAFEKILNYVKVAKIEHLGEGILQSLWDNNIVRSITDLYLLPGRNIAGVVTGGGKRIGASTANKINTFIEKAGLLELETFIRALGMTDVGEGTSERIVEKFGDIDSIFAATPEQVATIRDFGEITVNHVMIGLSTHKVLVDQLKAFVKFKKKDTIAVYNILNGAKFVVTGTMSNPRSEIEKLITGAGGVIQSGVSRSTNYVVVGEDAGSKLAKAQELGIKTINEDQLMELLAQKSKSGDSEPDDDEVEETEETEETSGSST